MKKRIQNIIEVICVIVLVVIIGKTLRFLLNDDAKYNSYTRETFHEMYAQGNIDVLFVGSSHCYRSFIPSILDKELGKNTFNAGTSAQDMDGSLMVIKEAVKNNDVEQIYLEVYFNKAFFDRSTRTDLTSTYIISDYLRPSVDKMKYLLQASGKENYANSFIVARRKWKKIFDINYIMDVVKRKCGDSYKSYSYDYLTTEGKHYAGKGYVANEKQIKDWNYCTEGYYSCIKVDEISDDWKKYISEIIKLCKKKNIKLALVSAPTSDYLLNAYGNYDDYCNCLREFARQNYVEYYDFNLCKETYFPGRSELFIDEGHLNNTGAEIFTHSFADLVTGKISEDEMFYGSYSEKMLNASPMVYGLCFTNENDENGLSVRSYRIVSNRESGLEYRIALVDDTGEEQVIRNFSDDESFDVDSDQYKKCIIEYQVKDDESNGTGRTVIDLK